MENNHDKKHNKLEYNQITPNIYIGTNMCCRTHFEEELLEQGITADISLEEEKLDAPFGVKFYLWLPTKDHTPPNPEQLRLGIRFIEELIKMDKKVYVHCKHGHGRAPTLVAAYLISRGKTVEGAVALIKEKRPATHLQDAQLEALKVFQKTAE